MRSPLQNIYRTALTAAPAIRVTLGSGCAFRYPPLRAPSSVVARVQLCDREGFFRGLFGQSQRTQFLGLGLRALSVRLDLRPGSGARPLGFVLSCFSHPAALLRLCQRFLLRAILLHWSAPGHEPNPFGIPPP